MTPLVLFFCFLFVFRFFVFLFFVFFVYLFVCFVFIILLFVTLFILSHHPAVAPVGSSGNATESLKSIEREHGKNEI